VIATRSLLIVDDEPAVLAALRDRLSITPGLWDVHTVPGAAAALSALAARRFDVVISDLRMPGMDGARLLDHVRRLSPGTLRLLLSGQADDDVPRRAAGAAHQVLTKPLDTAGLGEVIERATLVRRLIDDETAHYIGDRLDRLPSPPPVYWALCRAGDTSAARRDMARLVGQDDGVAARLVELANWPYRDLGRPARSADDAAEILGPELTRAFAVAATVLSRWTVRDLPAGVSLRQLRAHATITARIARRIADRVEVARVAFTAALLHGVGRLVIAVAFADACPAILARTGRGELIESAERAELGFDHATIGAYLLGLWALPLPIVRAVASHLRPPATSGSPDPATLLHVASALAHEHMPATRGLVREPWIDVAHLQALGVMERMQSCQWVARDEAERAAAEGAL
jgi:HD-like signal output (HDOD) protein